MAFNRETAARVIASAMSDGLINLLLVEDNAGDARLLREALSETEGAQFRVTQVERLGDGAQDHHKRGKREETVRFLGDHRAHATP